MKSKLLLLPLWLICACSGRNAAVVQQPSIQATALHYTSAMGSGKGVLFQFKAMSQNDSLQVDSVFVAGTKLTFTQKSVWPLQLEATYFVPSPEPGDDHARTPKEDAILQGNYTPAILYAHAGKAAISIPIDLITRIQNTE